MKGIAGLITLPLWIIGVIITKGFWSTFFAIIIPFWAWYCAGEFLLTKYHIL